MLESSDIQVVRAITDSGSLSKAAEVLNMSQPTLSKRLARLEQNLNISLFHRYNGGMVPTEAAEYLLKQGKSIQNQLHAMSRHVEMLSNLEGGELNIGVGPIIEQLYFPKVLLDFAEETTNVRVKLVTESADKLIEDLSRGCLDVVIGPFLKADLPHELIVSPVQSARIVFVARANHPLFETEAPFSLGAVAEYPSIAPSIPKSIKMLLPATFPAPLITSDNYVTSKSVVAFSDYITAGPQLLFEKEIAEGTLVEIPMIPEIIWTSYCVIKPESMQIPTVKKFVAVFDEYLER